MITYESITLSARSDTKLDVHFSGRGIDPAMGNYTTSGLLAEIHLVPGGYVAMSFGKPFRVFSDKHEILEWARSHKCPVDER